MTADEIVQILGILMLGGIGIYFRIKSKKLDEMDKFQ